MATRTKVNTLSIQYIAGFFDGEGGVNIYQTKKGVKKDRIGYLLSVFITNTNKVIIDELKKEFGGYINTRKRIPAKWKTAYEWKLSSNQASDFLKAIRPHLVLKTQQADVAIEFQELRRKKVYQFLKVPKEQDDFFELCYQKMRQLNKKGKGDYYVQRLNEETLKREAIVRSALKNAETGRNDLSALQEQNKVGGIATLKKYGVDHYREMRSRVKK